MGAAVMRRVAGPALALLALCLAAGAVVAKVQTDKVTVSGPGLEVTVEVTDRAALDALALTQFADLREPVEPPANAGSGYTVLRFFRASNVAGRAARPATLLDPAEEIQFQREQGYRPIDRVRYHPDAAGGRGYLFYEHLNLNVMVPYEGNWYRVTAKGDAAMRRVLSEHGVQLEREQQTSTILLLALLASAGLLALARRHARANR